MDIGSHFHTFESALQLSNLLNNYQNRLKFEQHLLSLNDLKAEDIVFYTKVIVLICQKMENDVLESSNDRQLEDLLLQKIILKFGSSGLQENMRGIDTVAQKIFSSTQTKIDSWSIFQSINNACKPTLVPLSKCALIKNLKENNEIDRQDSIGNTALLLAVKSGDVEAVKVLIENQADLKIRNLNGESALVIAAKSKNNQVTNLLIQALAGGQINDNTLNFDISPLEFAIKLKNNIKAVNELISAGVDVDAPFSDGVSPLFWAVRKNNLEMTKLLIQSGAITNVLNDDNITIMHLAIYNKNLEFVNELIKLGVSLNDPGHLNLLYAAEVGSPEIVNALIHANVDDKCKIDINEANEEGLTALMGAIIDERLDVFEMLVKEGADINKVDNKGRTVLVYIKEERIKNKDKYIEVLKKYISKEEYIKAKDLFKEFRLIKSVGHAYNIKGEAELGKIKQGFKPVSINLEGAESNLWFNLMFKDMAKFKDHYPDLMSSERIQRFESMLQFAADQKSLSNFERIHAGLQTIMNVGYSEHTISIFIQGDQIAICNRGEGNRGNPIEFFTFTPGSLTKELLQELSEKKDKDQFREFLFEKLPSQLNFSKNDFHKILEAAAYNKLPMQIVGNCSWTGPAGAVYAFMLLDIMRFLSPKEQNSKQFIEDIIAEQNLIYTNWLDTQNITILERLAKRVLDAPVYSPGGHLLLDKSINEALLFDPADPLNQERLNTISDIYEVFSSAHPLETEMSEDEAEDLSASGEDLDVKFESAELSEIDENESEADINSSTGSNVDSDFKQETETDNVQFQPQGKKRKADEIENQAAPDGRPVKKIKSES